MQMRSGPRRLLALGAAGAALLTTILVSAVSAGAHSSLRLGRAVAPTPRPTRTSSRSRSGVHTKSLLTVGDSKAASNGYEMVGIPDGLGARRDADTT